MCGQGFTFHLTEKVGIRKTALQFARLRPVANDDLRAREIEREERRQVLFYREPPDADEYRARQIERCGALGLRYLYLGYWIEHSPKMAYKSNFRPIEGLLNGRWERLAR